MARGTFGRLLGGHRTWLIVAAGLALLGCDSSSDPATGEPAPPSLGSAPTARCIVRLHGKGGTGAPTVLDDDVTIIAPTGNADGWGNRQWLYFPDDQYDAARRIVDEASRGCEQVIVNGFSNGASFAAKLYCRGETLDGRLLRVVVDDPVVDEAVEGCAPDPSVGVTLYWTGALDPPAAAGWDCGEADWTCEGGATIGIDAYAAALATEVLDSPFDEHEWYVDAPELGEWT